MEQPPKKKSIAQKMRENVEYMRARPQEFTREDIEQEIQHWKAKLDEESAGERKLSGAEKVAAFGSKVASGATFGFFDELMDTDTQRFLQDQYQKEHPYLATGAEVLGSLATPGSFLKVAKVAPLRAKAAAAVGEGVIQGGLSAAGNANGSLEDRVRAGTFGGGAGGVVSGLIAGATKTGGAVRRAAAAKRGVATPSLDEIVTSIPPANIAKAKQNYAEFAARGLGDEAKIIDVLPDAESVGRAARTANRDVAKTMDAELRRRSNRLANVADERFSQHTGTDPVSDAKARAERLKKAQDEASPLYEQSRNEAASYDPASAAPDFTTPEVLNRPRIKSAVKRVIADDPERFGGNVFADPKLSHDVLDQAYKDMGEEIRYLQSKVRAKTASAFERRVVKRMIRDREHLKKAISVRSKTYPEALDKYAGEIAHRDALEMGAKEAPADMIPDEMASLDPATIRDYKQGKAGTLRANTPNPDLGEYARFFDVLTPVASKEKAAVFKATFGEDAYKEYMADLLAMAKMQRVKAGAGQSETVDKLIEQIQLGGNPDLMDLVVQLGTGGVTSPRSWISQGLSAVGMDRLLASKRNAMDNATWVLSGGQNTPQLLDDVIQRQSLARTPQLPVMVRGDWRPTRDFVKNPAARVTGAVVGRRSVERPK